MDPFNFVKRLCFLMALHFWLQAGDAWPRSFRPARRKANGILFLYAFNVLKALSLSFQMRCLILEAKIASASQPDNILLFSGFVKSKGFIKFMGI